MSVTKEYRDGFVDVRNNVVIDETGVTKLCYPKLAKAAEIIGTLVAAGSLNMNPAVYCAKNTESIMPPPKTRRVIGYTVIGAGIAAGSLVTSHLI